MTNMLIASETAFHTPLELIPPTHPDFSVYGEKTTVERAAEWALINHYQLVRGVTLCPHGFYGFSICPGDCYSRANLDHVAMWYGHDTHELFLLCHQYVKSIPMYTKNLAECHGLNISSSEFDGWYGASSLPIKLSTSGSNLVWPIEPRLIALATLLPVQWPQDWPDD